MHNWQSRCSFTFPVLVTYFVVSLPLLCLIRRFSTSHGPREGDGGGWSLTYTLPSMMKAKKAAFPHVTHQSEMVNLEENGGPIKANRK
jgi:hypothetical protein